jgi:glycine oxidase
MRMRICARWLSEAGAERFVRAQAVFENTHAMPAPILIVGQGLAGSLLAWEFEKAGIDFEIADQGHALASSRIGAGIINPITGQRIVKSWRVDELLAPALAVYREMEAALGVALMRPMRVRRFFHDERERRIFAEKRARGELAPYVAADEVGGSAGAVDAEGFWIERAAHVDTARLIAAMRARLMAAGRLREERVEIAAVRRRYDVVILCAGVFAGRGAVHGENEEAGEDFGFASLRPAKGETLTVETTSDELAPDVILNAGHWLLPLGKGRARIGATFEPGVVDLAPTAVARAALENSAARFLPGGFSVVAQESGLRMTSADKHPVVGRSLADPRVGIFNGLGSKGALLAPGLARQWVNHLTEAVPFDPAVDVKRFAKRGG